MNLLSEENKSLYQVERSAKELIKYGKSKLREIIKDRINNLIFISTKCSWKATFRWINTAFSNRRKLTVLWEYYM